MNNGGTSDSDGEDESMRQHGGMRRVVSSAEISVAAANETAASSRDYKVRRSGFIGYVLRDNRSCQTGFACQQEKS